MVQHVAFAKKMVAVIVFGFAMNPTVVDMFFAITVLIWVTLKNINVHRKKNEEGQTSCFD